MQFLKVFSKLILIISITVWLTACDSSDAEANTNCIIGTATIGDCKI